MRVWKARPAESLNLAKLLFQREPSLTLLVSLQRQNSVPNLTMREGVQMRKVFALLLSVVMVMSLLVVAGAEDTAVTLSIEPQGVEQGATEVLFDVYLNPNGTKEIGAFQFSVSGQGCTITDVTYRNDSLAFNEGEGAFAYFGGNLNGGVYTFVAAGTAKEAYTVDGKEYPAHIWNAEEKTKIVTLKATIDSSVSCQLIVARSGDKQFSVGYDDGSGSGVQPCYKVAVNSQAVNLSGALLGDVNGDGKVNAKDVVLMRRYCANAIKYPLDAYQLQVADVFQDGKVNAKDVVVLRRYCANPAKYPLN